MENLDFHDWGESWMIYRAFIVFSELYGEVYSGIPAFVDSHQ